MRNNWLKEKYVLHIKLLLSILYITNFGIISVNIISYKDHTRESYIKNIKNKFNLIKINVNVFSTHKTLKC